MKKLRRTVIAIIVASLLLATASHAYADPPGSHLSPDQEWLYEHTGVRAAPLEQEWAVLTSRVGLIAPDDYAGSAIRDGRYIVGFKAGVPAAGLKVLSQFPARYEALTNVGFSLRDVDEVSSAIVGIINRDAPGTVIEIVPTALSPEIVVSINPRSISDVRVGGNPSAIHVTGMGPVRITVDPALALTQDEIQRVGDLGSRLSDVAIGSIRVNMVATQWEVPTATVTVGMARR
ncbi:MAG: hypothetical protein FWD75_03535 [Propionibacteriaceae bacterium]|nr:hypothetical protein [Propionibacteriaceae bacterium]